MTLTYQGIRRPPLIEDKVLAQEANHNQRAFAELYRRHLNRVYGYILSRTGHVQDAEDLTAQTFLAAMEGIDGYHGGGEFPAWLLGIARRKVADYYRNARQTLPIENAETFPYNAPSPEAQAEQALQMEEVGRHLADIPVDRAEALTLRVFGGLSAAETGRLMGKSEDAINMLVYRAMQELRKRMNQEVE